MLTRILKFNKLNFLANFIIIYIKTLKKFIIFLAFNKTSLIF